MTLLQITVSIINLLIKILYIPIFFILVTLRLLGFTEFTDGITQRMVEKVQKQKEEKEKKMREIEHNMEMMRTEIVKDHPELAELSMEEFMKFLKALKKANKK